MPHNYQQTLLVDLPLQGEGVQTREANRVPISWPWWEGLGRATGRTGKAGICWSSRMKRGLRVKVKVPILLLWLIILGHSYFLPLLSWDNQHLLPCILPGHYRGSWRPCQEFRWGCYLDWCLTDMLDEHYGMVMTFDTLSKELYSLKQGSRENVAEFWSVLVTAGSDTSVGVPEKDSTGACAGDEMRSFLWGPEPLNWCMLAHKVDVQTPC